MGANEGQSLGTRPEKSRLGPLFARQILSWTAWQRFSPPVDEGAIWAGWGGVSGDKAPPPSKAELLLFASCSPVKTLTANRAWPG